MKRYVSARQRRIKRLDRIGLAIIVILGAPMLAAFAYYMHLIAIRPF